MTNTKTYTVAGVSTLNGVTKARFSNDFEKRLFMLGYTGHEDIKIVELEQGMTKVEAVEHLKTLPAFQDEVSQAALNAFTEKNTPKAAGQRGRPLKLPTLADVATRGENGAFLKREVREQMLADMIAEKLAQHAEKKAKAAARAAAKALAGDAAPETAAETDEDVNTEDDIQDAADEAMEAAEEVAA